jgi:hypothetical protein
MKRPNIFFTNYGQSGDSETPKIFLDWYRHSKNHPYRGFSVRAAFLGYTVDITFVNDDLAYRKKMFRYEGDDQYSYRLIPWRNK